MIQQSISLTFEPFLTPLHISAKQSSYLLHFSTITQVKRGSAFESPTSQPSASCTSLPLPTLSLLNRRATRAGRNRNGRARARAGRTSTPRSYLFFFFITLGLEMSDTKVYEPRIRDLLGTPSQYREAVDLKSRSYAQHHTLNPTPSTRHTQPYTLIPTLSTPQPQPYTLNPTPSTLHPQPSTLNPHPQPNTHNPTPSTLHRTPSTLNRTPSTLQVRGAVGGRWMVMAMPVQKKLSLEEGELLGAACRQALHTPPNPESINAESGLHRRKQDRQYPDRTCNL